MIAMNTGSSAATLCGLYDTDDFKENNCCDDKKIIGNPGIILQAESK